MKRLVPIALVVLLLAACGGSSRLSKSQYDQHLQSDSALIAKTVSVLRSALGSGRLAGAVAKIDAGEAAVKKVADDLDSLKPPSDADSDNAKIVTNLRTIQAQLEKLKKALSADPAAALAAAQALQHSTAVQAVVGAAKDLKKKGYKVGVLGD